MSRKKTSIIENSIFVANINKLVDDHGDKYTFAEAIGVSYEAVRQWCIGENLPDGRRLLAIHEKFGVSIDWLLTGKEPGAQLPEAFMAQWPVEVRNACTQLKNILLSDHPVIKPALLSNLAAFESSVEREKTQDEEIKRVNRRLHRQEQELRAKQSTGTDGAASSSTG